MGPHWVGQESERQADEEAGTGLGEVEGEEHGKCSVKTPGELKPMCCASIALDVARRRLRCPDDVRAQGPACVTGHGAVVIGLDVEPVTRGGGPD